MTNCGRKATKKTIDLGFRPSPAVEHDSVAPQLSCRFLIHRAAKPPQRCRARPDKCASPFHEQAAAEARSGSDAEQEAVIARIAQLRLTHQLTANTAGEGVTNHQHHSWSGNSDQNRGGNCKPTRFRPSCVNSPSPL